MKCHEEQTGLETAEAACLFDRSKTAEEAAKITLNRGQLYLDER